MSTRRRLASWVPLLFSAVAPLGCAAFHEESPGYWVNPARPLDEGAEVGIVEVDSPPVPRGETPGCARLDRDRTDRLAAATLHDWKGRNGQLEDVWAAAGAHAEEVYQRNVVRIAEADPCRKARP